MNKPKRGWTLTGNESQLVEFKSNFGEGVIQAMSSAGNESSAVLIQRQGGV